jgi:hypothetical protein
MATPFNTFVIDDVSRDKIIKIRINDQHIINIRGLDQNMYPKAPQIHIESNSNGEILLAKFVNCDAEFLCKNFKEKYYFVMKSEHDTVGWLQTAYIVQRKYSDNLENVNHNYDYITHS